MRVRHEFTETALRVLESQHTRFFGRPSWPGFQRDVLEKPNLRCFSVTLDGETAGFRLGYDIGCYVFRSWLLGVGVEHRRQGVAAELVTRGNAVLRDLGYRQVTASMTPEAAALCGKLGLVLRTKSRGEFYYDLPR
jgi:ribosomal protein S18 acetylase RimI-like enzyme